MSRPKKTNRCFQQNDYTEKYQQILSDIKSKGIKVFHRKIKCEAAGLYDPETNIITIDKSVINTLDGCYFLHHEYAHYNQVRYNEHKEFFNLNEKEEYSDEKLSWIVAAEKDAALKAKRLLRTYGIDYNPQELDPKELEELKKFWKDYYFK